MSVETPTTESDPQEAADNEAVRDSLLHKTPIDPEVYRRVHEKADEITERLRRNYGVLEIAVDLVRKGRDEE